MLDKFLDIIYKKSPFQKKRLTSFLANCDSVFWQRANTFAEQLERYLSDSGMSIDYAVNAYLKTCQDTLVEQTKFLRSGVYSCSSADKAFTDVYSNELEMRSYMVGVALSQFLWENHYKIYTFFLEILIKCRGKVSNYLEIGPGHGLYLAAALNQLEAQHYIGVDISPVSLDICQGILPFLCESYTLPVMHQLNALEIDDSQEYDFITMGEVIEHLDEPRPLLRKIAKMLKPEGYAFLTTCANCPTIDHVYLFRNVQEIRDLFHECDLLIDEERVLPVEKVSLDDIKDTSMTINYAAVVKTTINK